jgi:hypothetical protein
MAISKAFAVTLGSDMGFCLKSDICRINMLPFCTFTSLPPKKVTVVKTGKSPTYKPPVPPASKPADTDFKDFSREELEQLRKQNNGKKAREHSTVYTTEKALSYAFYGIANEEVFNRVMENLDVLGAKGTFFITRKDLLNHADRVKEIAKAGHEIGICLT